MRPNTRQGNSREFAGGVPASVLTHWGQNRWSGGSAFQKPPLSFGKWQELGGRDVLTPMEGQWTAPSSAVLPGRTNQLELRNLLRDVQTIRLATDLTAALPVKVETIRFDDLSVTPVTRGSDFRITLRKVQVHAPASAVAPATETNSAAKGRCDIWMESTGGFGTLVEYIALDADGQAISIDCGSFSSDLSYAVRKNNQALDRTEIERSRGSIHMLEIPKTLIAKVFLVEQRLSYPAEVVVDLRSCGEQPQQLTELQSDGACPIEIEVLKIRTEGLFRVVDVNVKNSSNRTILRVDASMQYLDRAGTVLLEEFAVVVIPIRAWC